MTRTFSRTAKCLSIALALTLGSAVFAQEAPQSVKDALKRADESVAKIVAVPDRQRTFQNTVGAFDDLLTRLNDDTSLTIFMQNVSTDPKERDIARAADEAVSNWTTAIGRREDLYNAIKAYDSKHSKLRGEQARFLQFTVRDYHHAGMDLPKERRDHLQQIDEQLTKLTISFDKNIADDPTRVPLSEEELKGVPQDVIDHQPKQDGKVMVGMDDPTITPILGFAESEKTRETVWRAYKRRGGEANVKLLEQAISLRAEEARILGYKSWVDQAADTRMAKNSANIARFYTELRPIVRRKAKQDWAEFVAEKAKHTGEPSPTFNPWDYSFYKNLLMKEKYAIDRNKVSEYFPMERVVNGIFNITSSLYGLRYEDATSKAASLGLPIWNPDVKLYEVYDKKSGELLGRLYTDPYPREGKYTHAACWALQPRKVWADGTVQKPLAALVCNLAKPSGDKPALLPHDDVETFFHEFGHGLHNILTHTSMARFAGASGVSLDFVEAPSQMMENWVWSPVVLNTFARHYKTNEPIPASLLAAMQKAHTLGSGMETEHQFYYGIVDQAYHTKADGVVDTTKVANDMFPEIEQYGPTPEVFMQASFGHIMDGYEGGYYVYMWSLVYAQDMFQRFKQLGLLSPAAGQYYRSKILARGGSIDEFAMLRDYLGREPKMDAFLDFLGLKK